MNIFKLFNISQQFNAIDTSQPIMEQVCLSKSISASFEEDYAISAEGYGITRLFKKNSSLIVSAGFETHAIGVNNNLLVTGGNNYGQIGDGTLENSGDPIINPFLSEITGIACGKCFTVGITKKGKTVSWGQQCMTTLAPHHGAINSSVKEGTGDSLRPLLVEKIALRHASKVSASPCSYIVLFDDGDGRSDIRRRNKYNRVYWSYWDVFIKVQHCEGFMFALDQNQKIVEVAINDNAA